MEYLDYLQIALLYSSFYRSLLKFIIIISLVSSLSSTLSHPAVFRVSLILWSYFPSHRIVLTTKFCTNWSLCMLALEMFNQMDLIKCLISNVRIYKVTYSLLVCVCWHTWIVLCSYAKASIFIVLHLQIRCYSFFVLVQLVTSSLFTTEHVSEKQLIKQEKVLQNMPLPPLVLFLKIFTFLNESKSRKNLWASFLEEKVTKQGSISSEVLDNLGQGFSKAS